jgi:hypothetical protein
LEGLKGINEVESKAEPSVPLQLILYEATSKEKEEESERNLGSSPLLVPPPTKIRSKLNIKYMFSKHLLNKEKRQLAQNTRSANMRPPDLSHRPH